MIILLTALPGSLVPDVPVFFDLFKPDKLVHIFLFAVFSLLLLRGFIPDPDAKHRQPHAVSLSLNIAILLSAVTELMQKYFITGRVASVYDFIANVAGCFLGWWLFYAWMRKKKR